MPQQINSYENLKIPAADAANIVYNLYHSKLNTTRKRCLILYKYFVENPESTVSMKSVAAELSVSRNTVSSTIDGYLKYGVDHIFSDGRTGRKSCLDQYKSEIDELFKFNPPQTMDEATRRINAHFELNLAVKTVSKWMKKNGYKPYKPKSVPGKSDPVQQKLYRDYVLENLIQGALEDKYLLYFADGVHLIYGYMGQKCWAKERPKLRSSYGRKRFNCLGFLDAKTFQVTTITNDTYLNSQSLIDGMVKLRYEHPGKQIIIVLDNAGYQHNEWVKKCAEYVGVKLSFLPPYSPNLNLIERLWKFLKKKVVTNKYYDSFSDFCYSVENFLDNVHVEHYDELKSLLTFNFEILDGSEATMGVVPKLKE